MGHNINISDVVQRDNFLVHLGPCEQAQDEATLIDQDNNTIDLVGITKNHYIHLRQDKPKQTTEEVSWVEVVCTSKEPTTRSKPNTTHAPLRWPSPKTA
jgi:hypothetical protein